MCERDVVVSNLIKEMHFTPVKQQASRDGMDWRVTPPLVEEATITIERIEIVNICIRAQPVEVPNLKVGPEVAMIIRVAVVIAQEFHGVVGRNMLRVFLHELLDAIPERRNGLDVLVQTQNEPVLLLVLLHVPERVEVDVAEDLDAGLNAPVPLVIEHQRMSEEEAGLVAAHVPVADRVAIDDLLLRHLFAHLLGSVLIDEVGERPVLLGNLAIMRLAGDQRGCDGLELVIELLVVQEHPVVVVIVVETVLNVPDGLHDLPDVRVTRQRHEGRVHPRGGLRGRRGEVGPRPGSRRRL